MGYVSEPLRNVPVAEDCDVIVCGGGPAGVAAAIAAARCGASTRILELQGCLGGIWTSGLLGYLLDWRNKQGIMAEIIQTLKDRSALHINAADNEEMKLLLDQLCLEAGVRVQLHTRVVGAVKNEENALEYVLTESKSGRQAWRAKIFIDATGDGDLGALAGCGFDYGREGTGETQPMSLQAVITGLDELEVDLFVLNGRHGEGSEPPKQRLLEELARAGVVPSYGRPSLAKMRGRLFSLAANHEYGIHALDAGQITGATMNARAELMRIITALRSLGGIWSSIQLVNTSNQIGVRDGRRVHGRYRVSVQDVVQGVRHEDAVCRATFSVDVHSITQDQGAGYSDEGRKTVPYDIPFRALIAKDTDRLLMAGRCISGDFLAHASYRVTGNAVPMGEAAGAAAALAAACGKLPQELDWKDIEQRLREAIARGAHGAAAGQGGV